MAGNFAMKRSLLTFNYMKMIRDPSYHAHRTSKVAPTAAASALSTASGRAEGNSASSGSVNRGTDPTSQGMYEAKQEALDVDEGRASGVTGFMAEQARDGAEKAKEMADSVADTAKRTIDGARKVASETTEQVFAATRDDDEEQKRGPNRNIDPRGDKNIEDLRRRAGGYDKAE